MTNTLPTILCRLCDGEVVRTGKRGRPRKAHAECVANPAQAARKAQARKAAKAGAAKRAAAKAALAA